MAKTKMKSPANPVWDEVIAELNEFASTLQVGGEEALTAKYSVRQLVVTPPPELTADQVRTARDSLHLSQAAFAQFLGIGVSLVRAWEGGTRSPKGADRRLLADLLAHPAHWQARVKEAVSRAS